MIEINNISKTFAPGTVNEKKALCSVSLTVNDGDFITIIGSNGAGKSTLFNAVSGTFFPDTGSITLDGKDITHLPEHKRARSIGRVFQDPMRGTAPGMTIEENLALAYSRSKVGAFSFALNSKIRTTFREYLASFGMGLEDRMKTKVGLLSGGQRQVVTLLMSTMVTPKLLLLDEHTAALDPATAEKIMDITKRVVEEYSIPTLMITHNMHQALSVGTRTIMMDAGRIVYEVSGEERANMTVQDLLNKFAQSTGTALDNDRILLERKD